MAGKPEKIRIKFLLAVNVDLKWILNATLYLDKDEFRPSQHRLADYALKLTASCPEREETLQLKTVYFNKIS